MSEMSATEASRHFADVANRVAAGEQITVTRGGHPLMVMMPHRSEVIEGAELKRLLEEGPQPDDAFLSDIFAMREESMVDLNAADPWHS